MKKHEHLVGYGVIYQSMAERAGILEILREHGIATADYSMGISNDYARRGKNRDRVPGYVEIYSDRNGNVQAAAGKNKPPKHLKVVTMDELIDMIMDKIEINGKTVIFADDKSYITVGCTTVPTETVLKIAQKLKQS